MVWCVGLYFPSSSQRLIDKILYLMRYTHSPDATPLEVRPRYVKCHGISFVYLSISQYPRARTHPPLQHHTVCGQSCHLWPLKVVCHLPQNRGFSPSIEKTEKIKRLKSHKILVFAVGRLEDPDVSSTVIAFLLMTCRNRPFLSWNYIDNLWMCHFKILL